MKIDVKELMLIIDILKNNIEENYSDTIEIEHDYYWNIPAEEQFNPLEDPNELNLGQLSDDWQELKKLLQNETIPTKYNLEKLGMILKAIQSNNDIW